VPCACGYTIASYVCLLHMNPSRPIPFKLTFTVMETNSEPWDLGYVEPDVELARSYAPAAAIF
jgi:hypothetical protein